MGTSVSWAPKTDSGGEKVSHGGILAIEVTPKLPYYILVGSSALPNQWKSEFFINDANSFA